MADALDLQHRLPLMWTATQAGRVPAYQARRVATATRHLTAEHADWVDQQIAPALGAVSWGRLQTLLEAAIYQADPAGAEHQAAAAAQERFVRLGRSSEHGLKLIIARAAVGYAIWFKATIDRIADILARQGDTDEAEVRRSKAIGILVQPAEALRPIRPVNLGSRGEPATETGQLTCLAASEFADNLCCGLQTFESGPLRQERAVMFAARIAPGNLGG